MEGPEEGLGRRRSSRIMEETSGIEEEEEEEAIVAVHGRRARRDGEVRTQRKEVGPLSWISNSPSQCLVCFCTG